MTQRSNVVSVLLACLLIPAAHAATFDITSNADSGGGSLRSAIEDANVVPNTSHTFVFTAAYPNGGTISLLSALPVIQVQNLTISGGNRSPIISGQDTHQIFRVDENNTDLEIIDLQLRNGHSDQYGGCIQDAANGSQTGGTLRATRVVFSGCSSEATSLVYGGAVYWQRASGNVVVSSSRFSSNYVRATTTGGQSGGGAIYTRSNLTISDTLFENNGSSTASNGGLGGALYLRGSEQSYSISDSTFRGNAASPGAIAGTFGYGGAISLNCDDCDLTVSRSYFRNNAAVFGGAIHAGKASSGVIDVALNLANNSFVNNTVADSGGAVYLFKTLLSFGNNTFYNNDAASGAHLAFGYTGNIVTFAQANLFAPTLAGSACSGTAAPPSPSLVGANLFSDASCNTIATNSLPNSPLGTITLDETPGEIGVVRFSGSAVLDSISDSELCETRDARNQLRPLDGDGDGIAYCDVGAYEHDDTIFRHGFEN